MAANIRPACISCNSSKRRRLLSEYADGISIPVGYTGRSVFIPPEPNRLTPERKRVTIDRLRLIARVSTQRQIADSLGIHESMVSLLLNGKREPGRKVERALTELVTVKGGRHGK